MNFDRQVTKPPERGSFPLDHFHDCDKQAKKYNKCLKQHKLMPKRCRKFQIDYLQCRMKSSLMEETSLEDLGLDQEHEWDNERQEKIQTFRKIQEMKRKAFDKALKARRMKEIHNKPPDFPESEI